MTGADGADGDQPDPGIEDESFVEVQETHTSVLMMVGERTYKLKKSVAFPFLDLSTRQARVDNCRREFYLNRRAAPDVYLGVVELRTTEGETGEDGEPVVVMQRLPAERRLSALLADPSQYFLARVCVEDVAHQMARLHGSQMPVAGYNIPGTMRQLWRDGWEQTEQFTPDLLDAAARQETYALALEYLNGRDVLLTAREENGLVRDGHGDLLVDDVYLLDDGARLLDCLEFDDRLRVGDVLLDVAFLMMDLTLHQAPELARLLINEYRQLDAETHPRSLEHHYVSYRAWVRAKVECLRYETGDLAAKQRAAAALELSRQQARAARIHVVAIGGLPGTGKSSVARAIVEHDPRDWVLLSSDDIRKELAGLPPTISAAAAFGEGLYDAEHTQATYTEMARRAALAMERGVNVILDASWTDPAQRALLEPLAGDHFAALSSVQCHAPMALCQQRLTERRSQPHVSDADEEVLQRMAEHAVAWPQAVTVDTSGTAQEAAQQILDLLEQRAVPSETLKSSPADPA